MKNLKRILTITLLVLCFVNVMSVEIKSIEELEKIYTKKIYQVLLGNDINFVKLYKEQLMLERQVKLKSKDSVKILEKHLVKMDEYVKKEDNPMVKHLYAEKKQKLKDLKQNGSVKYFKTVLDEILDVHGEINLLFTQKKTFSKALSALWSKIVDEKFSHYKPQFMAYKKLKKELNEYKKELIQKQFPESIEFYKKNDYLRSLCDRLHAGETIDWSNEKRGKKGIEEEGSKVIDKIRSYVPVPDEKYKELEKTINEKNQNIAKKRLEINTYLIKFIDSSTEYKSMKIKLDKIQEELIPLRKKRKELSSQLAKRQMRHKHSANCNH